MPVLLLASNHATEIPATQNDCSLPAIKELP
jgi:hypothetical protein